MDSHDIHVIKRGQVFVVTADGQVIVRTCNKQQALHLARYLRKAWDK